MRYFIFYGQGETKTAKIDDKNTLTARKVIMPAVSIDILCVEHCQSVYT